MFTPFNKNWKIAMLRCNFAKTGAAAASVATIRKLVISPSFRSVLSFNNKYTYIRNLTPVSEKVSSVKKQRHVFLKMSIFQNVPKLTYETLPNIMSYVV